MFAFIYVNLNFCLGEYMPVTSSQYYSMNLVLESCLHDLLGGGGVLHPGRGLGVGHKQVCVVWRLPGNQHKQ